MTIAQARNFDAGSTVYTILSQLETLFAHRGNAHVLLSLREAGPLRFSEIAARIYERSTERLADTSIYRALQRLEQDGLVTADCIDSRHPIYRLTSSGDRQAAVIAALAETMQAQPV